MKAVHKILLLLIISVFFLENMELDSLCVCGVEFAHYRADYIRNNFDNNTQLEHFVYSPAQMRLAKNKHELIIGDRYYDIIKEEFKGNEHHLYCIADKGEGIMMKFLSWIKTNNDSKSPFSATTLLKNKLKDIKYLPKKTTPFFTKAIPKLMFSEFIMAYYQPPFKKIPVPPPLF
ncbi:MAG TPA: hypothetical protein PKL31_03910 [Fulvivirga sp.]|nr:hypothetical protein [Fulvivirga sp.]